MARSVPADVVRKCCEAVDQKRKEIVNFCRDLIRIPSITGHEKKAQEFLRDHLQALGLEIDFWEPEISLLEKHPAYVNTGSDYQDRPNVVAIHKGGGKKKGSSLILSGHIDVVTPEPVEKWSFDPWGGEIVSGRIYGRGASDQKGGIASMIKALETILDLGMEIDGDVLLESVVDEEFGGNGTLACVLRGHVADGGVVTEPTACKICPSHRGSIHWRTKVYGQGAHCAAKQRGVSAVEKAMKIYDAIVDLEDARIKAVRGKDPLYTKSINPVPICVGKFIGGEHTGTVPACCVIEGNMEFLPGEKIEEVKSIFEKTIADCCKKDQWLKRNPPTIEWLAFRFEGAEIPSSHPLVKVIQSAYKQVTSTEAVVEGFCGCDMRILTLFGNTPSVIFGPGSASHEIDEFVSIDELMWTTKVLTLLILSWCGFR